MSYAENNPIELDDALADLERRIATARQEFQNQQSHHALFVRK